MVASARYLVRNEAVSRRKDPLVPKPNTKFDLSLEDMELIETALQKTQATGQADPRKIHELLGRLHNQKTFFRPQGTYVSG